MRERTKRFALDVIKFVRTSPNDTALDTPKKLVRAACGVAGNYRSACRARSDAEFVAKLGVVLDEADEAEGWLDVFHADGTAVSEELPRLRQESKELRAIFFKANQTARAKQRGKRPR